MQKTPGAAHESVPLSTPGVSGPPRPAVGPIAMRRLHLPIHDPCHEDWDGMNSEGDARRFCDVCTKHVHDLSSMTEPEARELLAKSRDADGGRICVRYKLEEDGAIRFKRETTPAPSVWQMTVAAAGLALTMLTGCTDAEPDRVEHDRCTYEFGPWSFTAERGQGTCPPEEDELMGKIEVEPDPDPVVPTTKDPEPMVMGEAPMVEPPPPAPDPNEKHERMGKIKAPPEPVVEEVLMGDVALPLPDELDKEPCDGPKPEAKGERGGPVRL